MAAADACGLHAARGRQVRRAQAHAVHARAGAGDGLHVLDPLRRLQDGVDQDRLGQGVLGLELGQQLVEIVDVPGALDLGQHDHVELGAGGRHDLQDVVEPPGRVQRVDARPQPRLSEVVRLGHGDEAAPAPPSWRRRGSHPRGCRARHRPAGSARPGVRGSSRCAAARNGPCARAAPAAAGRAPARRWRGRRNAWRVCG